MTKMKMLARSWIWWPNLDTELEDMVRACEVCQSVRNSAQAVPVQPWPIATNAWERVHLDFAEVEGRSLLLMVDAYSKWLEVRVMHGTSALATVEAVRSSFAAYGLPSVVVTDNGPQFRSREFQHFLEQNGVKSLFTPPYHPQSNGAVERLVQTTKRGILKSQLEDERAGRTRSLQHRIDNFLFSYRTTPHSFTESAPCELFLGRKIRTRLSMLKPCRMKVWKNRKEKKISSRQMQEGVTAGTLRKAKRCMSVLFATKG